MSESDQLSREDNGLPEKRMEPEGCPTVNKKHVRELCSLGIPETSAERALLMTGGQSLEIAAAWHFDNLDNDHHQGLGVMDVDYQQESVDESKLLDVARREVNVADVNEHKFFEGLNELVVSTLGCATNAQGANVAPRVLDEFKMVFVVNEELKMGRGTIATQVAHGCLCLYRNLQREQLTQWETGGETKTVLSGSNAEHLRDLQRRALAVSLPSHLTPDVGKTPDPSEPCALLSIFGEVNKVDQITGTLDLF